VAAYCYLEWYRWQMTQEATSKDKPYWQRLRTAGLKERIRQQAQHADLEEILRLAGTAAGQQRLTTLLDLICDDPAATAA